MPEKNARIGVSLTELVKECRKTLRPENFRDAPGAVNGLQVQNQGKIHHIVACVDASLSTVRLAIERKADLMIVHHGLFWGRKHPWTGKTYELIKLMIENDLALYSCHLPLDAHEELGNNAGLAKGLGLKNPKPFFFEEDTPIGFRYKTRIARSALREKLNTLLDCNCVMIPGGPEKIRQVGVVTGGAGNDLIRAAREGVDTFITGEGAHWTYALAEELGLNVFYGGHYATETFGVKSLAAYLADQFGLTWEFVDYPTGL